MKSFTAGCTGLRNTVLTSALFGSISLCLLGPANRAEAACNITKFGELPVTVQDGRVLLAASINANSAKFIVDSGAFYSLLTTESAARLGLTVSQLRSRIDLIGIGGRADAHQTTVKAFGVPGLPVAALKDVEFIVVGNTFAAEADGLLGENVLGAADTEYDLVGGVIRLMRSNGCDNTKMAYWAPGNDFGIVTLAGRTELRSLIRGHATVNGVGINVLFDTGASQSSLTLKAAARAGVTPDSPGVIAGGVSRGLGPEVSETWIGKFDSFNLGGEEIKHIALRFGIKEFGIESPDMLLGLDFFRSHRIYIAKNQNRMFFTYNGAKIFDLSALREASRDQPQDHPAGSQATSRESEPIDVDGLRRRAASYAASKQFSNAIADYGSALAFEPYNTDLLLARGRLRLMNQDPTGAAEDFEKAKASASQSPTISLQVAYAYEATRNFASAIERFNDWVTKYPKDDRVPRVLHERCWCRAALGTEMQLAMIDCDEAIKHHNDDSQARVNRGLVWLRLGIAEKAIADFNVAIEKQPKSPWAFYGRAIAESQTGNSKLAGQDIKAATDLDAAVPDQFRSIGLEPKP